jgi:DNA-binding NtrC family response regulator
VIQRGTILGAGEVLQPADLPPEIQHGGPVPSAPAAGSLESIERQHIVATLKQVSGHRGKAAALLGIDPKTLYRKLLGYGITGENLGA